MLNRLAIQNYAIIDALGIDFSSHLNILTGETGAGKSIIMGALGLVLGDRAETSVLMNREKKCIIEGAFAVNGKEAIQAFFKANELDEEEELVVRREIAPNGKSRAFVNDTPVTLAQLQQLSTLLVDLHQQFDTLQLGAADFQRQVLDALSNNKALLKSYQSVYSKLQHIQSSLHTLQQQKAQFNKELDYYQFQHNELEEANFKENELEEIDQELKLLSNAEGIKSTLSKAYYELEEGETPIIRQIRSIQNSLQHYADLHASLPELVKRLESAYIELQDIGDEVDRVHDDINFDIDTIDKLNERLSIGYKLLKKHVVTTTNELLAIKNDLYNRLQAVLNIDEEIIQKEKEQQQLIADANALAGQIADKRKAQVKPLEEKVNKMLSQVGMPNARLKVDIKKTELNTYGMDSIEFLFDANCSNQFQPLRKVASGGELSRLMLCIKSLVAESIDLPTLIFDEIDTGISGEAAKQVGVIMKDLASSRQVICITHQPQIAGKANAHYFVYKAIKNNMVTTAVKQLSKEERITAIAQMLSGEKPTAAALENAREMVMN